MPKSHFDQICEQTKKLVIYGKLQEATDLVYFQLLRDYQKEGITTIDQYSNSGTNRVLRQAFTGTGKSVEQLYLAMRHIAQSKDNKVLFFVPTEELIQNLADHFRSNGIHTGFIKAGVPMTDRVQVYIASVATLVNRLDVLPFKPTLILADECFPAGTLVDGKPIEEYQVGDYVWSVPENSVNETPTKKKVTGIFQNVKDSTTLVKIKFLRLGVVTEIGCTCEHPIYVIREGKKIGWIPARKVKVSDKCLMQVENELKRICVIGINLYVVFNKTVYNLEVEDYHTYFVEGILVHNCHHSPSNTWSKSFAAFDCPKIGFSATPERLDGKGFDKLFDTIVYGNSYKWYIEKGYLAPWRAVVPENQAEALFSITKGDYDQKEQEDFIEDNKILGKAVEVWAKHCRGLKTIVFAPSIKTSQQVVEEYNQYGMLHYGRVIAAHLDGDKKNTPDRVRRDVFRRFKLPPEHPENLLIISNVNLLTEGISVPSCHVTQWLRKTKSSIIFDQGNGRSNRPEPGKIQYIIDHVGNLKEHGTPDRERTYHLSGRKKRQQSGKYALSCFQEDCLHFISKDYRKLPKQILSAGWLPCPECGTPVYIPKAQPGNESPQTRRGAEIEEDHEFVVLNSNDADLRLLNLNALFSRFDKVRSAPKFYRELMKYPNLTLDDFKLACRYRGRSEYEANGIWPEYCSKQIPQVNF